MKNKRCFYRFFYSTDKGNAAMPPPYFYRTSAYLLGDIMRYCGRRPLSPFQAIPQRTISQLRWKRDGAIIYTCSAPSPLYSRNIATLALPHTWKKDRRNRGKVRTGKRGLWEQTCFRWVGRHLVSEFGASAGGRGGKRKGGTS